MTTDMNVLFEVPFCLFLDICMSWLGGEGIAKQISSGKALIRLDTALCNNGIRSSLLEVYQHIDWGNFFGAHHNGRVDDRMQWLVARKIKISCLEMTRFPNHSEVLRSFIRWNESSLKVLKLTDAKGAMTPLTKTIAKECKSLETLCLERCNLTVPIAEILNNNTTIKELRLQGRSRRYRTVLAKPFADLTLFDKVHCPGIVKLALLDGSSCEGVRSVLRAFPSVTTLDLGQPIGPVVTAMLAEWKLQSLQLNIPFGRNGNDNSETALAIADSRTDGLKEIVLSPAQYSAFNLTVHAVQRLVSSCAHLTSVTLWASYFIGEEDLLVLIAEQCNTRLEVLRVGGFTATPAGVTAIADHCPNLKVLNVGQVMTEGLLDYTEIFVKCAKLERFRARHQSMLLTEAALTSIVAHCGNLQVLSFGVVFVPLEPWWCVLQHCQKLRTLTVQHYNQSYIRGPTPTFDILGVEVKFTQFNLPFELAF